MAQLVKEWKKNQTTRDDLNTDIYNQLDIVLQDYKTGPPTELYNDARLVTREILDNVYSHNTSLFSLGLKLSVNESHQIKIVIYHDGKYFDPFDPNNKCTLLMGINTRYGFKEKTILTESGRHTLTLTFDLSSIYQKGKII